MINLIGNLIVILWFCYIFFGVILCGVITCGYSKTSDIVEFEKRYKLFVDRYVYSCCTFIWFLLTLVCQSLHVIDLILLVLYLRKNYKLRKLSKLEEKDRVLTLENF